mmetsp:Transcript_11997/g.51650  ORF Transcript_11997/g.51650 Transcript_11997/m.51650 type:complete len:223 (-) Transcript_11997:56-724(-)
METSLAGCGRAVGSPSASNPGGAANPPRAATLRRGGGPRLGKLSSSDASDDGAEPEAAAKDPDPDPPPPAAVPAAPSPRNLAASTSAARAGIGAGTLADPAGFPPRGCMCRGCFFKPGVGFAPPSVGKASASSRFRPTLPPEAERSPGLERPLPARPAHPPPIKPPLSSPPPLDAKSGKSSADATLGSSASPRDARSTASSCALSTLFTRACRSCSCAWARA